MYGGKGESVGDINCFFQLSAMIRSGEEIEVELSPTHQLHLRLSNAEDEGTRVLLRTRYIQAPPQTTSTKFHSK